MTADDPLDMGEWSDPTGPPLWGIWDDAGTIDGESVTGIDLGQWHDLLAGFWADESNPILVWTATWQTSDLTHRLIDLSTETLEFKIYIDEFNYADLVHALTEGVGSMAVVPAPSVVTMVVFGVGLTICRLRRRAHLAASH